MYKKNQPLTQRDACATVTWKIKQTGSDCFGEEKLINENKLRTENGCEQFELQTERVIVG